MLFAAADDGADTVAIPIAVTTVPDWREDESRIFSFLPSQVI